MTAPRRPGPREALLFAGIPSTNRGLLHRMRFEVGDPAAIVETTGPDGTPQRILIIRDIEMERARAHAAVDVVRCPADYAPDGGLSGDREIATAQATAECLVQTGVTRVVAHRDVPVLVAETIRARDLEVICDPDLGVLERRAKDASEVAHLRRAQSLTEHAMRHACELVAGADVADDGILMWRGEILTSERVRSEIVAHLLAAGCSCPAPIVAGGTDGGDCHERGTGPLRTGEPVIIDIFPRDDSTGYNGDCTRTVVHGDVPDVIAQMHDAVVRAKAAAIAATRAGVTGEDVHRAATTVIEAAGYATSLPAADDPPTRIAMTHGTGHGLGLDVHEPPLLDRKGPELVVGDALTIEPGLYAPAIGGIRVEDLVIVTESGCENLNTLPEGLSWA